MLSLEIFTRIQKSPATQHHQLLFPLTCTLPPPLHQITSNLPSPYIQKFPPRKFPIPLKKSPTSYPLYTFWSKGSTDRACPIMGPIVLTQLATGLSVLAGAVIVKQVMDQNPMMGSGRAPRCPSCNGTGRVACMCTRWSDGDYGCRTCSGSGRMACSSCGGTGTGRPIPVQISVRPPNQSE